MIIDLLHNQIVSNTITDGFKRSVEANLVPALAEIYGDSMLGVQMYEDHLADDFLLDGVFYYPMTVVLEEKQVTHWVSWPVNADSFTDLIPYAYSGNEEIIFNLSPAVPAFVSTTIIGRSIYCEGGLIKINVHSTSPSPTFLAGKYSQTFIDEMARQLTAQISEKMSVEGLSESGLALELEFAPVTFMEHNSENVTYRRLLLTDGASAPRDFWVKWINHRKDTPYTVSDHPVSDEIEFLIGEGVPQKIREREYRHLVRTNDDKYQKSIGKRNITEWRELIKRAVKRGRLTQVIRPAHIDEDVVLVNAALASVAGLSSADVVSASVDYENDLRNQDIANELAKAAGIAVDQYIDDPDEEASRVEDDYDLNKELMDLIAHNKEALGSHAEEAEEDAEDIEYEQLEIEEVIEEEPEIEEETEEEELEVELVELPEDELDEEDFDEEDFDEEDFDEEDLDEEDELDEEDFDEEDLEEEELEELLKSIEEEQEEDLDEELEVENLEDEPEEELEVELVEEEEEIEEIEENTAKVTENVVDSGDDGDEFIASLEKFKSDISTQIKETIDSRIKFEYEKRARSSAEAEIAELRRKQEQLIIENRRLEAQAKKEYEERRRISEQRKLENDRLRAEIAAKAKAEAIEKERLVESARSAIEEKHRLERERLAEERRRIEDERRLAEDRAKAEAEARVQAERALEAERIRAAQAAAAQKQPAEQEAPVDKYADYTYIAKNVKLLFRHVVDYNVTVEIQKILVKTLEANDKSDLHIRVRATVPDNNSVLLEFVEFPEQEMDLLCEIIKALGNSGIGIAKAVLEDPKK